ncbi:hypothetical protein GEMRC1_011141 [Eukaryota sp. GEM-RC1]
MDICNVGPPTFLPEDELKYLSFVSPSSKDIITEYYNYINNCTSDLPTILSSGWIVDDDDDCFRVGYLLRRNALALFQNFFNHRYVSCEPGMLLHTQSALNCLDSLGVCFSNSNPKGKQTNEGARVVINMRQAKMSPSVVFLSKVTPITIRISAGQQKSKKAVISKKDFIKLKSQSTGVSSKVLTLYSIFKHLVYQLANPNDGNYKDPSNLNDEAVMKALCDILNKRIVFMNSIRDLENRLKTFTDSLSHQISLNPSFVVSFLSSEENFLPIESFSTILDDSSLGSIVGFSKILEYFTDIHLLDDESFSTFVSEVSAFRDSLSRFLRDFLSFFDDEELPSAEEFDINQLVHSIHTELEKFHAESPSISSFTDDVKGFISEMDSEVNSFCQRFLDINPRDIVPSSVHSPVEVFSWSQFCISLCESFYP